MSDLNSFSQLKQKFTLIFEAFNRNQTRTPDEEYKFMKETEAYNRTKCSHCGWDHGKGYVPIYDAAGTLRMTRCHVCREYELNHYAQATTQQNAANAKQFGQLDTKRNSGGTPMQQVQKFLTEYKTRTDKNWLYITGKAGTGKTTLAQAAANILQKTINVKNVRYGDMIAELKQNANEKNYQEILKQYTHAAFLIIDDLLKEKMHAGSQMTEADINHLFKVIEWRHRYKRPCIFTSELQIHKIQTLNEAIYWRIKDMVSVIVRV